MFYRFSADRTATQYDRLLATSCRLSDCNAVLCYPLGRCTGLKVVPACSYMQYDRLSHQQLSFLLEF